MIPENFCINNDILSIPGARSIRIIRISQIVYLKSCKTGTHICSMIKKDSTVCSISLDTFEALLSPRGFFRIHDNCIVNTYFVERVDKFEGYQAVMRNKDVNTVSRAKAPHFEKALLDLYRNLQGTTTGCGTKPTGYGTRFTVRGFCLNKLCMALYIWRLLYETVPFDTCLF